MRMKPESYLFLGLFLACCGPSSAAPLHPRCSLRIKEQWKLGATEVIDLECSCPDSCPQTQILMNRIYGLWWEEGERGQARYEVSVRRRKNLTLACQCSLSRDPVNTWTLTLDPIRLLPDKPERPLKSSGTWKSGKEDQETTSTKPETEPAYDTPQETNRIPTRTFLIMVAASATFLILTNVIARVSCWAYRKRRSEKMNERTTPLTDPTQLDDTEPREVSKRKEPEMKEQKDKIDEKESKGKSKRVSSKTPPQKSDNSSDPTGLLSDLSRTHRSEIENWKTMN